MHKLLLILTILFTGSAFSQAVSLQWAKKFGGNNYEKGQAVAVDPSGNVYTVGTFSGTVDFDPGAASYNLTGKGLTDIYITKLNSAGDFVWAKRIGGGYVDYVNAVQLDPTGNIYITGSFKDTVDFDPDAPVYNLIAAVAVLDGFFCKLDKDGKFVWAKQLAGSTYTWGEDITMTDSGFFYLGGYFSGSADFDPGPGANSISSKGSQDAFVCKVSYSGAILWARAMGGTSNDNLYAMDIDGSGNLYVTGIFTGTADFDPGSGTVNMTASGLSDIYIAKFNTSGNLVWARHVGGSVDEYVYALQADESGNVYTTGFYAFGMDCDPGPATYSMVSNGNADAFVLKLNSAGDFIWARHVGGEDTDYGQTMALDKKGNIYYAGTFTNKADFDPGTDSFEMVSGANYDVFISKLDTSGKFLWAVPIGGGFNENTYGMVYDGKGNIYISGEFTGTVDFDPGSGVLNLVSVANSDAFIVKIYEAASSITDQNLYPDFKLFPNPATRNVTLTSSHDFKQATIKILNSEGKIILEKTNIEGASFSLDLPVTPAGFYFIEVAEDGYMTRQRIIKQ